MLNDIRLKIAVVGGHTHTIVIDRGPDAGTPVDTGFIVLNDRTYPLLIRFLAGLAVPSGNRTCPSATPA